MSAVVPAQSDFEGALLLELCRLLTDQRLLASCGMDGHTMLVLPASELHTTFKPKLCAVQVSVRVGLRQAHFSLVCGVVALDGVAGMLHETHRGGGWLRENQVPSEQQIDLTGHDPDWIDNVAGWIRSVSHRWFAWDTSVACSSSDVRF